MFRRFCPQTSLLCLLTLLMARHCFALAVSSPNSGDGFPLVAQALRSKLRLIYQARQDILWAMPAPGRQAAQIIVDVARSGRHTCMTYRFPPEAAGRVMSDDGSRTCLYDPAHHALILGRSQAEDQTAAAPTTLNLLKHNYRCLRLRREVINGLTCDVVSIRPRHLDGPSKRLWIDTVHHAILRSEEYDTEGRRRYVSSYETIHFTSHLPGAALSLPTQATASDMQRIKVKTVSVPTAKEAFAAAAIPGRLPAWCPWGYTLLRCSVVSPEPDHKAVLLSYGDGLKTLTLLEEAHDSGQPSSAELNHALARYGQQAWVQNGGQIRIVVRGDLSLPQSLGAEMMQALNRHAATALSHSLARDFGRAAAARADRLRQRGWGYEQIDALCLGEKSHPRLRARVKTLLDRDALWPQIAATFGSEAETLEDRSRAWIASTMAVAH